MLRFVFLSVLVLFAGCQSAKKHQKPVQAHMQKEVDRFKTHRNLIKVYLKNNKPKMALNLIEPLLKEHPEAPELYNLKGVALDHMREHTAAQDAYRAGLLKFPHDYTMKKNLDLSRKIMIKG